jgi:N-acetylgalactosamine-N,N'-diacetylbacillosaminyl-diphospho-undecaprenol 4-alpha-N-acetylgalactosaminyltransferase
LHKKISILIYSLASGGAERVVSILLKELKGYEIELILMNDTIFYDVPKDIKIKYLEKSNPFESGIKKLLKLPLLGFKYKKFIKNSDVSISFMNRPNYINVFAKLFGSKVKTIISERIAPSQEYKTNSIKDKISRFLIKTLYKKADLVIPNSKYIAYELNTIFQVPKNKIEVIPNPIYLRECKKEKNEFIFINVARFEPQKNHKLLIKAFYKANLEAKLYLIGDGYLRGELEELVKELNLEKKVIFLGRQKDVFKYLQKASCFVFSSDYEGFPNVLLEALLCNLPIISTDCKSGPREILAPNTSVIKETENIEIAEYGILTKVGSEKYLSEAMKLIYKDNNLRYNFRQKTQNRIKEFEVKKIVKKWEKVI